MAYENDVYTRNEDSELAVRVVTATEGTNNSSYDDVFTRDANGKLAVRVVGAGGGDSHNLGYFATPQALSEAYPTGEEGDYAIVGSTDTVWIWDSGTSAWVDTDTKGQVESVNGQTGAVTLGINDVAPTQTGKSGYVLGTDGFVAGWVKPEIVQVSAMPTASEDEVDNIYQFVGTTDANYTNGYFYKCVSDGQDPATYSWTQTDVQPAPSGLPDQTGNAGKFLTTDGTDASWSNKLVVTDNNIRIGTGSSVGGSNVSVVIGGYSNSNKTATLVAGPSASCGAVGGVALGAYSTATAWGTDQSTDAIAIGHYSQAKATHAIQLGATGSYTTNLDANTFKVGNQNGNFEIMSADGTIPSDRLPNAINKYSTMPTAASTNEGWIVQFTGTTDSTYTHGYIYECKAQGTDPETYAWEAVEVQAGGGGGGQNIQVSTLPTASATEEDNIYQFVGASGSYDGKYLYNGYFYKCVSDGAATPTYSWNAIPVMNVQYFSVTPSTGGRVLVGGVDTYAARCTNAVIIGNGAGYSIGGTPSNWYYSVIVGQDAKAHSYCVSVGFGAVAGRSNHIAIGYNAKNTTTSFNAEFSINIGGGTVPGDGSVAIGSTTNSVQTGGTAVGRNSKAGSHAVAMGNAAEATGGSSIAIKGKATAQRAIQIGIGTNSESDTFCVGLYNNSVSQNYKMLDSDGTIPEARLADTTNAQQGDVLTLDSNGNAVWQAGGSGGGSTALSLTLAEANWSNNSITVTATGVTASNNVIVSPAPASQSAYTTAGVMCTAQAADSLTFTCTTTPSSDLTVTVLII